MCQGFSFSHGISALLKEGDEGISVKKFVKTHVPSIDLSMVKFLTSKMSKGDQCNKQAKLEEFIIRIQNEEVGGVI